jgi:Flp pilus assembly protein TadG
MAATTGRPDPVLVLRRGEDCELMRRFRCIRQLYRRPSSRVRDGQSLVELAIIAPVLMLILLGTIDLGRMYADYVDLKHGARDGAGYGLLKPSDTAGMKAAVLAAGVPASTTPTAKCNGSCTVVDGTGEVEVTASSTFSPVTLGFFSWLGTGGKISLHATAKMRVLS